MTNVIELRPHHGLCVRFFEGKGYSSEFTKHMAGVIEGLRDDTIVKIAGGNDYICSKCPNLKGRVCESEEHVMSFDGRVLCAIGLKAGDEIAYGEFQKRIQEEIFDKNLFRSICGDCGWAGLCHG